MIIIMTVLTGNISNNWSVMHVFPTRKSRNNDKNLTWLSHVKQNQ